MKYIKYSRKNIYHGNNFSSIQLSYFCHQGYFINLYQNQILVRNYPQVSVNHQPTKRYKIHLVSHTVTQKHGNSMILLKILKHTKS